MSSFPRESGMFAADVTSAAFLAGRRQGVRFAETFFKCRIESIVYGKVNFVDDGSGTGKTKPVDPVLYDLSPLYYLNSVTDALDCKTPEESIRALDLLLKM